jgi:FdhD protein
MAERARRFPARRLTAEGDSAVEESVAQEFPLTIILDNQELVTLLCSPFDLKYLAAGFLLSEGVIESGDEIARVTIDEQRGVARVDTRDGKELPPDALFKRLITSGCGRGASFLSAADAQSLAKVDSQNGISAPDASALVKEFQRSSKLYLTTHGVHSAALCAEGSIVVFCEDLGRHNAIDKIFGRCLLEHIPVEGRILLTSGRVSSEILLKVARRNVPVVISISAPTDVAVELADTLGVTLVGSARGGKMDVFTHEWRMAQQPD